MRLIDRLTQVTATFHDEVDGAAVSQRVSPRGYQRYLARTYGFVAPVERSITTTPDIERYLDMRRFNKEELLRRDLEALRYSPRAIGALPQCSVPLFDTAPQALGWAYFLERSTRSNNTTFRALAATVPGEMAFASSYLKCYFGAVGEMWSSFSSALDLVPEAEIGTVIDSALAAFRAHDRWQRATRERATSRASTSGSARIILSDYARGDDETTP